MQRILSTALSVTLIAALSLPATAEPKPRGSKPADPQVILDHYAGNTWNWSQGAAYWRSDGVFQATWKKRSMAEGKWYVTTKGTLCYEARWTGPNDDGVVGSDDLKRCWKHVRAKDGQIWQKSHDKNEWYRLNPDKVVSGNAIRSEHRRIKASLGQ